MLRKVRKDPLKQVVPDYKKLKNDYTLLWDMKSNEGYINIVSILFRSILIRRLVVIGLIIQNTLKIIRWIITNGSQDLLTTYRLGWKTSYYQNTYDAKKDIDEPSHPIGFVDNVPEEDKSKQEDENCDSCTI